MEVDFDTAVKLDVYSTIAATAKVPTAEEVARSLGAGVEAVRAAFGRLHAKRLLVPEPGDPSRIRMAPPFSGVPTPFLVKVAGREHFANCSWDALGIAAALHRDAAIEAADGATGEPLTIEVKDGRPLPSGCVAHFAVPAARWWDDIVHT